MPTTLTVPVLGARPASRRVAWADLGLHRGAVTLIGVQLTLVAGLAALYARAPFAIAWSTALPQGLGIGMLAALWLTLALVPGKTRRDWIIAEVVAVLILILTCSFILGSGQYLVALWDRPLVDASLAAADARLGVSVPALVAWTRQHPWMTTGLGLAYFTLLPQFVWAILGTGVILRDRDRLWEFARHFHVCALVTLTCSGLWPASCAFSFYGFESLLDQSRFLHHFESLRAGTFAVLRFDDIEGLISFPSFHVAGALMVTWAFRGRLAWLLPLIILNTALIAATMLLGAHYAVDVLATVAVFALSVGLTRATRVDMS